jgi:membrane fusion protein (multidrug efflux system)
MNDAPSPTTRERRLHKRIYLGSLVLALILIGSLIWLFTGRHASISREALGRKKAVEAGPVVQIVPVTTSMPQHTLELTGEARPFLSVTLYAKISGYLKTITVDKGDRVHEGQLIATIESPETDQAYISALADAQNKQKIWQRDSVLVKKQYISQQEEEQALSTYQQAVAFLNAQRDLMQYKDLRAPFDGTVTARYADQGALLQNAANAQTGALPLVTVSELDRLRIYVYVNQADASYLKDGYPVTIGLDSKPNMRLERSITRIAGELDPKTRMMLAEIDIQDLHDTIVPGSFVQVYIRSPAARQLVIPDQALITRGDSFFVAMVDSSRRVYFKEISMGSNDGEHVEVLHGLSIKDSVLVNGGENLSEGEHIRTTNQ